jgi:hypothetical protein
VAERLFHESQQPPLIRHVATLHPELPVPHPLDFEWRFTDAAADLLLDEALGAVSRTDPVLLLGTSSLVMHAHRRRDPLRLVALDANTEMLSFLQERYPSMSAIRCNILRDKIPSMARGGVVITDPPWYPEYLTAFLWACSDLCTDGGVILVSLPPIGTRPGIAVERAGLCRWATELGLELVRLHFGCVPYSMPLFEQNALRSQGVHCVPLEWRRGDLAVFKRVSDSRIECPGSPHVDEHWPEVRVGRVRIRLRNVKPAVFADPALVSVIEHDVLPSVSRRDWRRQAADVWTSGNRIFKCQGTGILHGILLAIRSGHSPNRVVADRLGRELNAAEAGQVDHAARQVSEVLRVEQDEHSRYAEEGRQVNAAAVTI